MKKVGVIGAGSPFGADNIAQYVIEQLKPSLVRTQVQCEYYDRPGIHLLELLKHFNVVHLIDAVVSDKSIGTIHRYDDFTQFQNNKPLVSSHGVGLAEALALGKTLDCLPERIIIHGIEIREETTVNDVIYAVDSLATIISNEITIEL